MTRYCLYRRRAGRKASKPTRRHTVVQLFVSSSDSEDGGRDGEHRQAANSGLVATLLQHMAAAGVPHGTSAQPGAADVCAAGLPAAAAGGCGAGSPARAQLQELVQEDVDMLRQEWQQHELPKLQALSFDIWHK